MPVQFKKGKLKFTDNQPLKSSEPTGYDQSSTQKSLNSVGKLFQAQTPPLTVKNDAKPGFKANFFNPTANLDKKKKKITYGRAKIEPRPKSI